MKLQWWDINNLLHAYGKNTVMCVLLRAVHEGVARQYLQRSKVPFVPWL